MKTVLMQTHHEPSIVWDVTAVRQVGPYSLDIEFNGGDLRSTVNFEPFLAKAKHPDIRRYLEPSIFSSYQIKDGNLMWGDYELIFPVEDLLRGKIS